MKEFAEVIQVADPKHIELLLKAEVEEVTLLGPDEYQSSKHPGDLGDLPGVFNDEDKLQAHMKGIRIQKYLRKKLPSPH